MEPYNCRTPFTSKRQSFFAVLCFFLIFSSLNTTFVLKRAWAQNLTQEYKDLKTEDLDRQLQSLKDHQIIFVAGLFSGFVDFFSCYFCEYYSALENLGLIKGKDFQKLSTQTESAIKNNIPIIKKAILDSEKPVILITHSKGSVETLETLVKYPDLAKKVKAWVSIQGAIKGSFFADGLTNKDFAETDDRSLSQVFLQQFYDLVMLARAGNNQALLDLRTDHRNIYLTQNRIVIQKLTEQFPILSIASYSEFKDLPFNYRLGQNQLGVPNFKNDGLIQTTHQILPGSYHITFANTHHNTLVAKSYGKDQDLFLKKVLSLVLSK